MTPSPAEGVGSLVELTVGPVAHGGHCVARHAGRVVFVRHTLPGERVRARLTDAGEKARFWRADAVQVLEASVDRVPSRCPASGPGGCGGCDWQHVDLAAQRLLKAEVVAEQLRRLAGLEVSGADVLVESVPGDDEGLGWRTRMRLSVDEAGRAGLRAHRSHEVVPLDDCPLAEPTLHVADVLGQSWPPGVDVLVTGGDGEPSSVQTVSPVPAVAGRGRGTRRPPPRDEPAQIQEGPQRRRENAAGRPWRVTGAGFWQVHPGAAQTLVDAVEAALMPAAGESLLDLYSGVGLFAGSLADALGPSGSAVAVESDPMAARDARRNLHDLPTVRLVQDRVEPYLRGSEAPPEVDLVVLDPPRSGAGAAVCAAIAARTPRAVAYVACDPAALARDVATFAGLGYSLAGLRAFDLFPMTHHMECVATLRPLGTHGRMVAEHGTEA
jgi:tRNA/tmRNA/rRNA uracil-C5-methylase (TrmA/RlmC/RlmD family)